MSEGKYPRMPKPKDKSGARLKFGELRFESKADRDAREHEEETGDPLPARHEKRAPEESMLARLGRSLSEAAGSVSRPWARLMDDDEEKK